MLTVVYILCAVTGAFLILNAVLVITLHRINNKLAKKPSVTPSVDEGNPKQDDLKS